MSLGFALVRQIGSHRIFANPQFSELINIQEISGKKERYQLKQIARIIEKYGLMGVNNFEGLYIDTFFSEEDACYVADVSDLEYCSAFGET